MTEFTVIEIDGPDGRQIDDFDDPMSEAALDAWIDNADEVRTNRDGSTVVRIGDQWFAWKVCL